MNLLPAVVAVTGHRLQQQVVIQQQRQQHQQQEIQPCLQIEIYNTLLKVTQDQDLSYPWQQLF